MLQVNGADRLVTTSNVGSPKTSIGATTTYATFTSTYTLKANENAGTHITFEEWGAGFWGSTQAGLTFGLSVDGAAPVFTVPAGSNAVVASHNFSFTIRVTIVITNTGVSGFYDLHSDGDLGDTGGNRLGAQSAPLCSDLTGNSIDTTVDHTFKLQAKWTAGNTQTFIGDADRWTRW